MDRDKNQSKKLQTPPKREESIVNRNKSMGAIQQERSEYVMRREELSKEWLENEREKTRLEVKLFHTNINMKSIEQQIDLLSKKEYLLRTEVKRRVEKEEEEINQQQQEQAAEATDVTLPKIQQQSSKQTTNTAIATSYSKKIRQVVEGNSSNALLPSIMKTTTEAKTPAQNLSESDRPTAPSKPGKRSSPQVPSPSISR